MTVDHVLDKLLTLSRPPALDRVPVYERLMLRLPGILDKHNWLKQSHHALAVRASMIDVKPLVTKIYPALLPTVAKVQATGDVLRVLLDENYVDLRDSVRAATLALSGDAHLFIRAIQKAEQFADLAETNLKQAARLARVLDDALGLLAVTPFESPEFVMPTTKETK